MLLIYQNLRRKSNIQQFRILLMHPTQDDPALWNMYVSALQYCHSPSEAEKRMLLQMLLSISGSRADAIRYLDHVKRTLEDPDTVQIGVRHLRTFS
jgi:hypothetical protein